MQPDWDRYRYSAEEEEEEEAVVMAAGSIKRKRSPTEGDEEGEEEHEICLEGAQSATATLQSDDGTQMLKQERKKSCLWLGYEANTVHDHPHHSSADILNLDCGKVNEDDSTAVKVGKKQGRPLHLKRTKKIKMVSTGQGLNETAPDLSPIETDTLLQQVDKNPENPHRGRKKKSTQNEDSPLCENRIGRPRKQKSNSAASSEAGESAKKAPTTRKKTREEKPKRAYQTRGIKNVGDGNVNAADPDLDISKMTIKDIIWIAEAKEKMLKENTASKKTEEAAQAPASRLEELSQPEERTSFAPQVQIIDGRIVINQDSLTVSAGPVNEVENFRRVEETHSKLNYHSYLKRIPTLKWTEEDTELFYKAIQQFGTDFGLIKNLFPGKSRRHILLKFKKEERIHPLRLADALTHKPEASDHSEYKKVITLLNLSMETTEHPNGTSVAQEDPSVSEIDAVSEKIETELSDVDLEFANSPEIEDLQQETVESVVGGTKPEETNIFVSQEAKNWAVKEKSEDITQENKEDLSHNTSATKPKTLFSYHSLNQQKPRSLFSYQQI